VLHARRTVTAALGPQPTQFKELAMASSGKQGAEKRSLRFEATLGPLPRGKAIAAAAELDLDRLPDVSGKVRLLISPADAQRLLDRGFEVRLMAAVPVKPLDPKLVMADAESKRQLEAQVKGLPRKGGQ
jgi:hypothetical protein